MHIAEAWEQYTHRRGFVSTGSLPCWVLWPYISAWCQKQAMQKKKRSWVDLAFPPTKRPLWGLGVVAIAVTMTRLIGQRQRIWPCTLRQTMPFCTRIWPFDDQWGYWCSSGREHLAGRCGGTVSPAAIRPSSWTSRQCGTCHWQISTRDTSTRPSQSFLSPQPLLLLFRASTIAGIVINMVLGLGNRWSAKGKVSYRIVGSQSFVFLNSGRCSALLRDWRLARPWTCCCYKTCQGRRRECYHRCAEHWKAEGRYQGDRRENGFLRCPSMVILTIWQRHRQTEAQHFRYHSYPLNSSSGSHDALEAECLELVKESDGSVTAPDAFFLCAGSARPTFWIENTEDHLVQGMEQAYWVQAWTAHVRVLSILCTDSAQIYEGGHEKTCPRETNCENRLRRVDRLDDELRRLCTICAGKACT